MFVAPSNACSSQSTLYTWHIDMCVCCILHIQNIRFIENSVKLLTSYTFKKQFSIGIRLRYSWIQKQSMKQDEITPQNDTSNQQNPHWNSHLLSRLRYIQIIQIPARATSISSFFFMCFPIFQGVLDQNCTKAFVLSSARTSDFRN